jgi:ankyrin repeat protein
MQASVTRARNLRENQIPTGIDTTPLIVAAQDGHVDVIRTLLAAKADVNAKAVNGITALVVASSSGQLDVVQALLDKGAGVNTTMADGRPP